MLIGFLPEVNYMFLTENLNINEKNHLTIGGADTVELAKKYKTPLYVMDEDMIRKNCRIYKQAIDKYYDGNGIALYASKAFSCVGIYKIAMEEGLGVDVVSGGELYCALKAGFPCEKIYFHGNNKTYDELEMAVESSVGRIVVDNVYELEMLSKICKSKAKNANIMFRIKPGVDAHTHDFVKTGQIDSKFGVALENGEAIEIIREAKKFDNINVVGIHCHIGSQIFELEPFCHAAEIMLGFVKEVKDELGIELEELNLGGGFGIKYVESDDPIEYDKYIKAVSEVVKEICAQNDMRLPKIIMEPGRSLVGNAGITLYTVGCVKDIKDIKKYIFIDGGMGDNPRYILYGAEYTAVVANKANEKAEDIVSIAGKCCESGDLIGENMRISKAEQGDVLAILATGAYNYSMASNYNRIPRPAVVMVANGKDRVLVRRETYEDIISKDVY